MFISPKSKKLKTLIATFLALIITFSIATPAFAKTFREEAIDHSDGGYGSPEYYEFTKMYAEYFLDFLPDESQPELLQLFTNIPDYDGKIGWIPDSTDYPEAGAWSAFFSNVDPITMRDEVFRVAKKLDIINPNLSQEEKADRIRKYTYSQECDKSIFGNRGIIVDGITAECVTQTEGLAALFRLAGIPAIGISMVLDGGKSHSEAFFLMNGEWHHSITENTFLEIFSEPQKRTLNEVPFVGNDDGAVAHYYSTSENLKDEIVDIDEPWIKYDAERFMFQLLRQPYAYPNEKLTRGLVAKLLCNYLHTVPMKNEQVFTDVPTTHKYSRYIWVMNKLGIMNGSGDGTFRPDAELSIQEFAVMACNAINYQKQYIIQEIEEYYKPRLSEEELSKKKEEDLAVFSYPEGRPAKVFADNDKIAAWAKPSVDELSKFFILEGDTNGYLSPSENMSKTRFLFFLFKFEKEFKIAHAFFRSEGKAIF
jgi:hypothetical protein